MALDLEKVKQTAFPVDFVQEVKVDRPIECRDELIDVVNEVRSQHAGIMVFGREAVNLRDKQTLTPVSQGVSSVGWHVHQPFDAVQVSQGSEIPTLVSNLEDVLRSTLDAIYFVKPLIDDFSRRLAPISFAALSPEENLTELPSAPLNHHLNASISLLRLALDRNDPDSHCLTALNIVRQLMASALISPGAALTDLRNAFRYIATEAQTGIPKDRILALSPKEYGASVIPAGALHARAYWKGQMVRPPDEDNLGFGIDIKHKGLFTREDS